jgi:small basic protein (TIGR04137 family)
LVRGPQLDLTTQPGWLRRGGLSAVPLAGYIAGPAAGTMCTPQVAARTPVISSQRNDTMTIDKSLKVRRGGSGSRSVLTRAERLVRLKDTERWKEGDSPLGLPKVRVKKLSMKKKKKKAKDDEDDGK